MASIRRLPTLVHRPISITSVSRAMLKKTNPLTPVIQTTLPKVTTINGWIHQHNQHQSYSTFTSTATATVTDNNNSETILSTDKDKDAIYLTWNPDVSVNKGIGSSISSYSHVWLRDNCPCEQCLHPTNRQKLHSTADVDIHTEPISLHYDAKLDQLRVEWNLPLRHQQGSDSSMASTKHHISYYPLSYLRRYADKESSKEFRFEQLKPRTWTRDQYQLNWLDYKDYMETDEGLHQVVEQLYNDGLVFLKNVPTLDESVTQVAERIGPIQETFYGRDFDVKNVAKSVNIAYTSLYLGFHMDLMYLDCPPGIQLLHSLKNSVTGGSSIFLDSFKAVELLKEQYPEDYQVLVDTPVTFHYINNGHHMYYRRPTIVTNDGYTKGDPHLSSWQMHVNYAPPFQGPMDHLSPKEMKRFYQAFQRFADFVEMESLRYEITLQPGQLVLFANRRVLHGRTAFDPTSGDRHLKGTYLTLDSLKDKLRVLGAKYNIQQ
ncbi:unnamed protein product [Cunninghamella blakesleeana]